MKTAKRYPFLHLLQQRLRLSLIDEAAADNTPSEADFRRWIWQAAKSRYRHAEIGLLLAGEEDARRYNRDYRGKDYATNVLSFVHGEDPCSDGTDTLRGDLVICPQVVAREAAEQGKSLHAHFAHLTLHGTLHLMGYDHTEDAEAEIMEAVEIRLMHQLAFANPYSQDGY